MTFSFFVCIISTCCSSQWTSVNLESDSPSYWELRWRWSTSLSYGKCLWSRLHSPDRNTLIAFSAVLSWMEHIMWRFLSFSLLSSFNPLTLSVTLAPRLQLIWSSLHRRNTHGHMRTFTSADTDQMTMASLLSACQWFPALGLYLRFSFPGENLWAWSGQNWWTNDLLMNP